MKKIMFFLIAALFIFSAAFAQQAKTLISETERGTVQEKLFSNLPTVIGDDTQPAISADRSCADITVGTGTTATYAAPMNTYWVHSYVQELYSAADLGTFTEPMAITSLSFEYTSTTQTKNVSFYLGNTTKTTFGGTAISDWVPLSDLQEVFNGNITLQNGWVTVNFSNLFVYTGGGLVVAILKNNGVGDNASTNRFIQGSTSNYATLRYYSDSSPFNMSSPVAPGAREQYRNNMIFKICQIKDIDMSAVSITGNLNPMATTTNNYAVTVSNVGMLPASNFTITLMADGNVLGTETVTATLANMQSYTSTFPVTFTQNQAGPLTLNAVVTIDNDESLDNNETSLNIVVAPHPGYIMGECHEFTSGTAATYYYLPVNNLYNRSYTEQIYDAAEINLPPGTAITRIAFLPTHASSGTQTKTNQTVYLANTTKSVFTSASDHIPPASLQLVYTGSTSFNHNVNPTWQYIEFDVPFIYTGGNLALVYVNNHGAYSTNFTFRTGTSTGTKAIASYTDSNVTLSPTNITGSTNTYAYRNHVRFMDCDKLYTLHPLNILDPKITLDPDPVPHGETATVNFVVDDCHYITDVLMDGVSIGVAPSYTFGGAPITDVLPYFEVITEIYQYTITSSCGANGTVSPLGTVDVDCGSEPTYTFIPNVGYEVNQIFIDGVALTLPEGVNIFSYTFPPLDDSHTIYVTFKNATWYINASSSGCGNVYPNGTVGVPHNNTQVFTFYPNEGCEVTMVYVDGVPYPDGINTGSYTFYYVTKPHTLEVVFDKKTYPVTANISAHGVINNQGTTYVEHGDNKTYTFYTMPGYKITYVKIDGYNNFGAIIDDDHGEYTFENVTGPHTIDVIIAPKIYDIIAETTVG